MTKIFHKVSPEVLYHMQCGYCKQWWTIGDILPPGELACPKCRKVAELQHIPEGTKDESTADTR